MPIYEYKCSECGHFMDALQGVNDSPLKVCPECSEKSLKRLISAPNFRLSGEGWYETDFKTGAKKNVAGDSSGAVTSESSSSDSASSPGADSPSVKETPKPSTPAAAS